MCIRDSLSGGQRQRVAIGRAIVRDPQVFLFDEPLSNLDAELRVEMRLQIARLHNQLESTMIYVTHDQVEAMTMADRIVVLRAGHVEQVGTPLELYHHPDNLFVAGFIGSPRMNFMQVELLECHSDRAVVSLPYCNGNGSAAGTGTTTTIPVDASAGRAGSTIMLGIRPEDVGGSVATDGTGFVLQLSVDVAERLGGSTFLYGSAAGIDNFVVQRPGIESARGGDRIDLSVAAENCYLFDENEQAFPRLTSIGRIT